MLDIEAEQAGWEANGDQELTFCKMKEVQPQNEKLQRKACTRLKILLKNGGGGSKRRDPDPLHPPPPH